MRRVGRLGRAGDPDLHTHVAVANKVQTLDGRWLSIDGRVLFKAKVAASETYNTALEQHLRDVQELYERVIEHLQKENDLQQRIMQRYEVENGGLRDDKEKL